MRNTGIRYNSKERMPTVLSEMAELLPPLSGEQLAVLEADLLANGCYAPVIVNEDNDTLDTLVISGQNRSVIRHPARDELAPQIPEPQQEKKQRKEVER